MWDRWAWLHEARAVRRCEVRRRGRGLTLIEILVVIAIVGVLAAGIIAGTRQLPSTRLKRSATLITAAIKVGYTRATATSKDLRLVLDFDQQKIWLEESDIPMLVQSKDRTGTGGAMPLTVAEQEAVAEGEAILKPQVPRPRFHPIEAMGFADAESGKGGKPLERGIKFHLVQTAHDAEPRTEGRAYLYFWPGGLTERAVIQLRIGDDTDEDSIMSLVVSPLTGKVTIKSGAVELKVPTDDSEASEREDRGI